MPKFLDIKLREYIFSPRFKNQNLETFLEFKHDYTLSKDKETALAEASYFAWKEKDGEQKEKDGKLSTMLKIEEDLLLVLAEMEYTGVYVDREKLVDIGKRLEQESKKIEQEIYDQSWETFNINSAKQVQYILFEKLKIPAGKKIKTGFSVDNEVLSYIGKDYEIANMILTYRGLKKLQSTYVEWLLKEINPKTGRIHTTYNQVQASTGRLSSENPNLQNIPAGDGYAMEIKSCFTPRESDFVMLVADYSQVELRVLANLSGDPSLLDAFNKGDDIHARTGHFLFGEETKITSDLRRIAKSVNFGVIYGITGFGLSKMINSSPSEATQYIETFFAKYPKVREYYDGILSKARECGYVETFFGRRRYIPSLNDANNTIRSGAEREAMNMPIQWTAADVIKLAMISLSAQIHSQKLKSRLLMQVHDELVFEVHKDEKDVMEKIVRETMEWVFEWEAKLIVDLHFGANWAEAKG